MKESEEFKEYVVHDLLKGISGISSRAMFGGYGIYKDGKIFAIIVESELYFKSDETTKSYFKERGGTQFTYKKKDGRSYAMNYWLVPADVMENGDEFIRWADVALHFGGARH